MVEIDEQALAERAKSGDDRAFTKLVEMYERVIYNLAFRMTNDREDARDITQTVFVKAYQNLRSFDSRHRFFSWIYRIGVNESLNARGKARRHEELDPDLILEGDKGGADERAETLLRSEAIEDSLMMLSIDYRTVIILRHFLELNQAEMAQILELPEKTVKSRLHSARQLMAGHLGRRGIHQS
jgi:RNA polymerase sigma-70 factor (ECF subfamily)